MLPFTGQYHLFYEGDGIMHDIRQYILGVVAAALLCGISTSLIHEKTALAAAVKFVTGLLMVLAVLQPWTNISLDFFTDWHTEVFTDANNIVSCGKESAKKAYCAGIKEQLESYIQHEANALGAELSVQIALTDDDVPVPNRVVLSGDISPSARQTMSTLLTERLGISREDLIWT